MGRNLQAHPGANEKEMTPAARQRGKGRKENQSEVSKMPEEQKRQAEKISAEMNKLTPEAREKVLIFVQGMTAMLDTPKKQPKEAV